MGVEPRKEFLDRFVTTICQTDPVTLNTMRPDLRRARISAETLADVYVPAAARVLGRMWEEDKLSFSAVTVGSSRLQAILRDVGEDWSAEHARDGAQNSGVGLATVLLVLPEGETHTLGAIVLAGQLRRKGVSVCLSVGAPASEVRQMMRRRQLDGIMVSVGSNDKLEICRNLVKTLREGVGKSVRIVLGGAILEKCADDAATLGADILTSDLDGALQAFGLDGSAKRAGARA